MRHRGPRPGGGARLGREGVQGLGYLLPCVQAREAATWDPDWVWVGPPLPCLWPPQSNLEESPRPRRPENPQSVLFLEVAGAGAVGETGVRVRTLGAGRPGSSRHPGGEAGSVGLAGRPGGRQLSRPGQEGLGRGRLAFNRRLGPGFATHRERTRLPSPSRSPAQGRAEHTGADPRRPGPALGLLGILRAALQVA